MKTSVVTRWWLVLACVAAGVAMAQTPDLEPGVQTSAPVPEPSSVPPATPPATSPAGATHTAPPAPASATPARAGSKTEDRIQLDTTQISGNRELPKVMYVVPWRKADLGEFAGRPPNSLLDEALTPVDRDVFRRQNHYYAALQAGAATSKSQPEVPAAKAAGPETKDEK
ncbi:MAG TPA: hypothetical protein VGH84_14195 [Steroidobacteraceae bacterium]